MKFRYLFIAFVVFCVTGLVGQTFELPDFENPQQVFESLDILYGALIVVGGYFSHLIPGLGKVGNNTYRVLSFGILSGIAFVSFGANVIGLILTYAVSTNIYQIILKWILPTSKVKAATTAS